jgi:hypothetical protein
VFFALILERNYKLVTVSIKIIIIVLFVSLANCYAQATTENSIHQQRLIYNSIDSIKQGLKYPTIYHAKVWACEDTRTIYEIKVSILSPQNINIQFSDTADDIYAGWAKWLVADMNFDGYPDIRIATSLGMHGDIGYSYYLFNPKTKLFNYNDEFSKLCGDIKFDKLSKTIIEEGNVWSGGPHSWNNKYKLKGNELIRIETYDEQERQNDDSTYNKIFKSKLVNGHTVVLEDTTMVEKTDTSK